MDQIIEEYVGVIMGTGVVYAMIFVFMNVLMGVMNV